MQMINRLCCNRHISVGLLLQLPIVAVLCWALQIFMHKEFKSQPWIKKCLSSGPNTLRHILPFSSLEKLLTHLSAPRILGLGHVTFSNSSKKRPICGPTVMRFVSPNRLCIAAKHSCDTPTYIIKTQKSPVKSSLVECWPLRPRLTSLWQDSKVSNQQPQTRCLRPGFA